MAQVVYIAFIFCALQVYVQSVYWWGDDFFARKYKDEGVKYVNHNLIFHLYEEMSSGKMKIRTSWD